MGAGLTERIADEVGERAERPVHWIAHAGGRSELNWTIQNVNRPNIDEGLSGRRERYVAAGRDHRKPDPGRAGRRVGWNHELVLVGYDLAIRPSGRRVGAGVRWLVQHDSAVVAVH